MTKVFKPSLLAASLLACFQANAVVYEIENLDANFNINGTIEGSRSGFGITLNDQGKIIGGASGRFAPLVSEEDREAVMQTNIDAIVGTQASVDSPTPDPKRKPESNNFVFVFDDVMLPSYMSLLEDSDPADTVGTTDDFIFGINGSGTMVGTSSSPAYQIPDPDQSEDNDDRDEAFWASDYDQRALFVENGVVTTIEPPFSTYGGQSGILAINDNGLAVGYASTGVEKFSNDNIDDRCLDDWVDEIPLAVCTGGFSYEGSGLNPTRFYLDAYQWQITDGEVVSSKNLGKIAHPIDEDDVREYNSIATDVNNAGIAVGRSQAFRDGEEKISARFRVATVFRDGEIIDLMDHSDNDWISSVALGINDNNLVVGTVQKNFSGFFRDKFFIYDLAANDQVLTFPRDVNDDKETDLATVANDINNQNMVVGSIEIDSDLVDDQRRTHGFLYQHSDQSFTDLNDLLNCRSKGFVDDGSGSFSKHVYNLSGGNGQSVTYEADIAIVDANKINEDGSIIATALMRLPKLKTQWVDEDGNVVESTDSDAHHQVIATDSEGRPIFAEDIDGTVVTEQLPRAIVLRPTSDSVCDIQDKNSGVTKVERSGAPFGFGLLLVACFGWLGRRGR